MNKTYKTNKTDWRRLGRSILLVALLLAGTTAQAQVSGGKVTLDDRENHSWSYYSDASLPELLRSLNPADVQIIYHGKGQKTISTTNGATPAANSWTQNATTVQVSATEADSVFIYYKTLERTDGSTSETPTGRCKYTTIANPFSVRPTYQYATGDLNKYCGFYAWRVVSVSGGTIYDAETGGNAINAGGTINAETDIYFAPTAATGMVVELEALWARAYVKTGNANTLDASNTLVTNLSANSYERNFFVITAGNTDNAINRTQNPVTISCRYPDGTSGGSLTSRIQNNVTCNNATKFEYVVFRGGSNSYCQTISGNNNYLIIGRGVTGYNNGSCANIIQGISANTTNGNPKLRIESGTYTYLRFLGNSFSFTGHLTSVLGSDYDRAKKDNTKLAVTYDIVLSNATPNNGYIGSNSSIGEEIFNCTVKSGNFDVGVYGEGRQFYCSVPGGRIYGKRFILVEGGIFSDISGGTETVNIGDNLMFDLRVKGTTENPEIRGVTYGAAQEAAGAGHRRMVITGGWFKSWIAGGANGTSTTGGKLNGNTSIYFGGNAQCNSNGSSTTYGYGNATGGNIFGAGSGNAGAGTNATVGEVDQSTVIIADECLVERNVYGGGNYGYVVGTGATNKSEMYILGGTVNGSVFGGSNMQKGNIVNYTIKGGTVKGGVYGGSNSRGNLSGGVTMAISGGTMEGGVYGGGYGTNTESCNVSGNVNITMTGGTVLTGLYGGGNVRSVITGTTTVNVNGGTIGASGTPAGVYGGGLGQNTRANSSVTVNIGAENATSGATIYGDVYGGSAKGSTNYTGSAANGSTAVTLNAGTIYGSLYGGAHGLDAVEANVYGAVTVTVNGGKVKPQAWDATNPASIFGCNNAAGSPKSTVSVTVNATDATTTDGGGNKVYAINGVYGGGNLAHYDPSSTGNYPTVTVNGCSSSIKDVYGGGNAAAVPYTYVTINGGDIYRVFAGGNGESGTPANVGYKNTDANPTTGSYGSGTATANIYGGTIGQVFGGSNANGVIRVSSSINIDKSTAQGACPMIIGEVYRGGNEAPGALASLTIGCTGTLTDDHSAHPENIGKTLEGIGDLYGGSRAANNTGDINLNITSGIINRVFGGNNIEGTVSGTITVNVNKNNNASCANNWYVGNVFGGGNLAQYSSPNDGNGNPTYPHVNILNGNVSGNVYGGGKGDPNDHTKGQVTGNPVVTIGDATPANSSYKAIVSGSVFGGGDAGNVAGTPVVNVVEKCNTEITTAVYGGGNAADVTGTNVTINGGTIGDVFGGGNGAVAAANVTGATSLAIHGGTISRVFAGGNTSGTIGTNSGVTIDHTSSCNQSIAEVYGGGNQADGKAGTVSIACSAENIGDVYGGANKANVTNDITLNITGGQINNVFGGNNTSGSISGGITVNINKDANCNTFSVNNVYGGGNLAQYTIPNNKALAVNILNGNVSGNVYGGGKGTLVDGADRGKAGKVTGNPAVNIGDDDANHTATILGEVYGGGDAADVAGTPVIIVKDCNTSMGYLYGGGNAADVNGATITFNAGTVTGAAFGGGHGDKNASNPSKYADVNGSVTFNIYGGSLAKVFAGSNSRGTITGTSSLTVNKTGTCDMKIGELYGGGNEASGKASTLNIGCTGTLTANHSTNPENIGTTLEGIGSVFGGANQADIGASGNGNASNITVNINSGMVANVFGGNNTSGTIYGSITVNIEKNNSATCASSWYVGNVYGGGNLAQYSSPNDGNGNPTYPHVNILNGTVSQNVYGGGKGSSITDPNDVDRGNDGKVTGNPVVTIGDADASHTVTVTGSVFGGGDAATVAGTPSVTVKNSNTTIDGLYGGGNAADVSSATLEVQCGSIETAFCGGRGVKNNNLKWADVSGNSTMTLKGGTIKYAFAGSNANGEVKGLGKIIVDNPSTSDPCPLYVEEMYCGSNEAAGKVGTVEFNQCPTADISTYDANRNNIGTTLEGVGLLFGGSRNADVTDNISLTFNKGLVREIYGGNNVGGNISGTITLTIDQTDACWYVRNVYGGGYAAAYNGTPKVWIKNTNASYTTLVSGDVYGGGYNITTTNKGVLGSDVEMTGGLVNGSLYGGCNEKGSVEQNTSVKMSGGTVNGSVYGGACGANADVKGNTDVTLSGNAQVGGNVYGGGNAAPVSGNTSVKLQN